MHTQIPVLTNHRILRTKDLNGGTQVDLRVLYALQPSSIATAGNCKALRTSTMLSFQNLNGGAISRTALLMNAVNQVHNLWRNTVAMCNSILGILYQRHKVDHQ